MGFCKTAVECLEAQWCVASVQTPTIKPKSEPQSSHLDAVDCPTFGFLLPKPTKNASHEVGHGGDCHLGASHSTSRPRVCGVHSAMRCRGEAVEMGNTREGNNTSRPSRAHMVIPWARIPENASLEDAMFDDERDEQPKLLAQDSGNLSRIAVLLDQAMLLSPQERGLRRR